MKWEKRLGEIELPRRILLQDNSYLEKRAKYMKMDNKLLDMYTRAMMEKNPELKKVKLKEYREAKERFEKSEIKGVPKRDGSGKGVRANRGRGGCNPPKDKGLK